jgi:hypothetical protein
MAGVGVWADIAWHVDFGRDIALFTPPHTAIVIGLQLIALSAVASLFVIKPTPGTGLRFGRREYPYGAVFALLCSGVGLASFPVDALWHALFGLDLTEWSPTHLMLITGPVFSLLGFTMLAQDVGVRLGRPPMVRVLLFVLLSSLLIGLSVLQAEYAFGISPFNLLVQPVLIIATAAFSLVLARAVLGRYGAIGVAGLSIVAAAILAFAFSLPADRSVPWSALYLGEAVIVELVFQRWPGRRGLSLTLAIGAGLGTAGLGSEWLWANASAPHRWPSWFLPEILALAVVASVAAVLLARACAAGILGRAEMAQPRWAVRAAVVALTVAFVVPCFRTAPSTSATVTPFDARPQSTELKVQLHPSDANRGANIFEVVSFNGGKTERITLDNTGPGSFVSSRPIPIGYDRDVYLRLDKGNSVGSVTIWQGGDEPGESRQPLRHETTRFESVSPLPPVSAAKVKQQQAGYLVIAVIFALWLVVLGHIIRSRSGSALALPRTRPGGRIDVTKPLDGLQ